jgi:two-component SAPR family response regulator
MARTASPEHAVELFVAAGAGKRAAELAGKHARTMFRAGRIQTLEDWSHKLESAGAAAPEVLLYLSTAYLDMGKLELSEATLERATEALSANAPRNLLIEAETQRGLIALRKGQPDEALRCADRADELITPAHVSQHKPMALRLRAMAIVRQRGPLHLAEQYIAEAVRIREETNDRFGLAAALVDLFDVQLQMGRAIDAEATQRRAHELFLEIGAPVPLAISHNNMALSAHLRGRYEEALALYREGFRYARQSASPVREAFILYGQADLFSDLDLALQAAELYGQGLSLATQMDNAFLIRYGCVQTSVLHRRRGGSSLAHDWLRRAMDADSAENPSPAIRIQLASLEMLAAPKRARQSLLGLLGDGRSGLDSSETALVHYFLARAAIIEGDLAAAELSLAHALTWAGSHGSEQSIAAELSFDPELRSFARRRLANNPVLSVVFDRIETMRTLAQQYKSTEEEPEQEIHLEVGALGLVKLQRDGQRLGEVKPLFREILVYLVDHRRVSRDELLETFWPHYPPGRQVANLHTAIYGLRRSLGKDAIVADGSVYSLNPELSVDYDVVRFERAAGVAEGLPPGDPRKLFALTEAINSYGGTFLPEFGSEWVMERRRALELRYLDLLSAHADEALVRDQPLRAVMTLREALKIDPLRDDTNRRLLEALGRLGRRSDIVAHYQRYVRLLSEELGLDPPQEVRELYNRLIV